jgi:hypothetical protein
MTETLTLEGYETTANIADVDIRQIASSEWSERKGAFIPNGGRNGAIYVNNTTPDDAEMTLVTSCLARPGSKGQIGSRTFSVTLSTIARLDNDVSGAVDRLPVRLALNVDWPAHSLVTTAMLAYLVQNLFGTVIQSAASGVGETVTIGKLQKGIPQIY